MPILVCLASWAERLDEGGALRSHFARRTVMQAIRLKGGSLSGTYLMKPDGRSPFVRKQVSAVENREYGFQRWYSQLKRLQRYSVLFPGLFPAVIEYGINGDLAYFDMEYIPDAITAHEFLVKTERMEDVEELFSRLVTDMDRMHGTRIASSLQPLVLYVREEVEQKLRDALQSERFRRFLEFDQLVFNGQEVPSFAKQLDRYKQLFVASYQCRDETFTHGNITLENILYQPLHKRLVFIDPYEENIIDSVLAEYSQLYQSCDGYYELYNERQPSVEGNSISVELDDSAGLDRFDALLTAHITKNCSEADMVAVRLLEISQFIRMLPFKMVIDESKMILFYGLASKLFHDLKASAA
jgi:hypothetical protein